MKDVERWEKQHGRIPDGATVFLNTGYKNASQRWRNGLENVANLNKLPPKGFHVIVAPIKIETGTGGPVRIFAIVRKK